MRCIASVIVGSRAYGTDIPGSDFDLKQVHIPSAEDILLQRIAPSVRIPGADIESYALHRFLELAAEGHPVAVEMLCAPEALWETHPEPEWLAVLEARHSILNVSETFVRQSARQAARYGSSSETLSDTRRVVAALEAALASAGPDCRVREALPRITALGIGRVEIKGAPGGHDLLVIGNKRFASTMPVTQAIESLRLKLNSFGTRTGISLSGGGVDWKATMHALRLAEEGEEYHLTGGIVLPRPNADYLRSVRLGEVPFEQVAGELEEATGRAVAARSVSVMPAAADRSVIETLVLSAHSAAVSAMREEAEPEQGVPAPRGR